MTRLDRRQRIWLRVLHQARDYVAESGRRLDSIRARGLLEEPELAALAACDRHYLMNFLARDRFGQWSRARMAVQSVGIAVASAVVAWLLVGGARQRAATGIAAGVGGEVAGLALWALAYRAVDPAAGPLLSPPPVGTDLPTARIGTERWPVLLAALDSAVAATPVVSLAVVAVSRFRGLGAVALVAPLLAGIVHLSARWVERAVRRERLWRFLTTRGRGTPIAADVAVMLMFWPALTVVVRRRRGGPAWLVAVLRQNAVGAGWLFLPSQWASSPVRGRARRRELVNVEHAFARLTVGYADAFEQAMTPDQREAAVLSIRDHLRQALAGDLSFLDIEDLARAWWLRALIRALPAGVLGAAAVALPYLPGVTATGGGLVGVQVGLAVAAVLTLVGASSDTQKTVTDAIKSVAAAK